MILTSPISCASDVFLFIASFVLYFLSSDESDSLNDKSDELGSDSGSSGMYYFCAFSLRFDESVVRVLGSDVFAPTGFESKGGRLLELFWSSNSWFPLQVSK